MNTQTLLGVDELCTIVGLSKPTIYRLMNNKQFPRPVKLSKSRVAWRVRDIDGWIKNLPSAGGEADE